MHVALVQQAAADNLAGPALEQHIIRYDDGGAPVLLQDAAHMLDEVELLVAGRGPEIVAHDVLRLTAYFALVSDKGNAALLAEGRIGQHHVEVLTRMRGQAIGHVNGRSAAISPNAVQVEVYHAQAGS